MAKQSSRSTREEGAMVMIWRVMGSGVLLLEVNSLWQFLPFPLPDETFLKVFLKKQNKLK
jgi:hypothetical protein